MLRSIHIKGGFKHADSTFTFQKGLTSITGPNESGKSLIMEFVRYGLWGSSVLRGSASDYKNLEVTLKWDVKSESFEVYRGKKGDRLWQLLDGKRLDRATGTKPVNAAIKAIFGYDVLVFDVANSCLQGEVETLGKMKPAERKRMVDQTIGLQFIDSVIEWASSEALAIKRSAESLADIASRPPADLIDPALVAPTVVELPQGFKTPADLRPELDRINGIKAERAQLEGWLGRALVEPVAPAACDISSETELQSQATARTLVLNNIRGYEAELARILPAKHTSAELAAMRRQIEQHSLWCEKSKLLKVGSHTCPKCDHSWPIMGSQLDKFKDVVETDAPTHSLTYIAEGERMLAQQPRKEKLEQEIAHANAQLATLPDVTDLLRARREYDSNLRTYTNLKAKYDADVAERAAKQLRLDALQSTADLDHQLAVVQRDIEASVALQSSRAAYLTALDLYNRQLAAWEQQKAQHAKAITQHAEIVVKAKEESDAADAMIAGREALKQLKINIKKFLVPSLNAVASKLLDKMTGGKRSQIKVDEDFNITVDGQELATLSGSGKAVANLAIRIGLGQVLTNKVFPVFIADEIDAAMDNERAGLTAECLAALAKEIGQVMLISHKKPTADHYIELG